MAQAATFGRRGTAAAPPSRTNQPRPAARMAAPAAPRAPAAPKARDDTLISYFLWLLFGFDGRLDRRTYRYCRVVANAGFVFLGYNVNSTLPKLAGNPAMQLALACAMLVLLGVMCWTTLAMQVKRRHDRDKAWPWLFVGFIPIAGPIWVLVETCWLDGTPGFNRFERSA